MQIKILTSLKTFFQKALFEPYYSDPVSSPGITEELKVISEMEQAKELQKKSSDKS